MTLERVPPGLVSERLFPTPSSEAEHRGEYPDHWERYEFAAKRITGTVILDVACGAGYGSALIARATGAKVTGLDVSAEAVAWATRHYGDRARFAIAHLPWGIASNSVDTVVSLETFEHLAEGEAGHFLGEIHRVLKPRGRLILSTPANESADRFQPHNPFHLREYSWDELGAAIQPLFDIEERWSQCSRLGAAWAKAKTSRLGVVARVGAKMVPIWVRSRIARQALDAAGMRAGTIESGRRAGASVQLVIASKSPSGPAVRVI